MFKTYFITLFVLFNLNYVSLVNPTEGESCYSYAGGTVYPQEFRDPKKGDHKLGWTKAMSKYTGFVAF